MRRYLAIDLGASSGRHIVGWEQGGYIETEEVYRFGSVGATLNGHLVWDTERMLAEVKAGIAKAQERFGTEIESLSVDTWGVDYVLMDGDKEILPCYAYRDSRTAEPLERVHEIIPFEELYQRTAIQLQPFNTIYQLYADKLAGRLERATDFLMTPEYLLYKLCGEKAHEYTEATTGGMVSVETNEFDPEIIERLGLPAHLFHELDQPGKQIGEYQGIKVVLCCSHDTASAVEGIPMEGNHPYLSSGTWSLLGLKVPKALNDPQSMAQNWSNEGGPGYRRYQKNIMGLWVVNQLREELCPGLPFAQVVELAQASGYEHTIDINHGSLMAPASMAEAVRALAPEAPQEPGDFFRCAYESLAVAYGQALRELAQNTGTTPTEFYVVGGGAKNDYLNGLMAKTCGVPIRALPIEATALGNLRTQMRAAEAGTSR